MGIPDHPTCLLRIMYAGKKQQLGLGIEKWIGSKLGNEYDQAVYCHLADLSYMQSTSCKMFDWMKVKLESTLLGEIPVYQICRWHHSYGKKQRGTNEPLDEGEKGDWKSWLKAQHPKNLDHGIQSHHFMENRSEEMWKQWQISFYSILFY